MYERLDSVRSRGGKGVRCQGTCAHLAASLIAAARPEAFRLAKMPRHFHKFHRESRVSWESHHSASSSSRPRVYCYPNTIIAIDVFRWVIGPVAIGVAPFHCDYHIRFLTTCSLLGERVTVERVVEGDGVSYRESLSSHHDVLFDVLYPQRSLGQGSKRIQSEFLEQLNQVPNR
jgi:hypothetical protein